MYTIIGSNIPHIFNLSNSIIGVTLLTIPFCLKQCGIIFGSVLLFVGSTLTIVSCELLMCCAITSRRTSYNAVALLAGGSIGKYAVDMCIVGMLLGISIAFNVVIGDLGPKLVANMFGIQDASALRSVLMIGLSITVIFPLSSLRTLESISRLSTISIAYYSSFVLYVIVLSLPNFISGHWIYEINYWRSDCIANSLPIFCLAFSCQTQLFIIYTSILEPSMTQLTRIIRISIGFVSTVYLTMGFFGYVAFYNADLSGNILINFPSSALSTIMQIGFLSSVILSYPLVVVPCRFSIYTLCWAKDHEKGGGPTEIPSWHFYVITIGIVTTTLSIGVLLPHIEFVLTLNGATMGALICFIFPALIFLTLTPQCHPFYKTMAKVLLAVGLLLLVFSSYFTFSSSLHGDINTESASDVTISHHVRLKTLQSLPLAVLKSRDSLDNEEFIVDSAKKMVRDV